MAPKAEPVVAPLQAVSHPLNRQPDSPGVVSLTPEQRGGDYRSVVYGVYPAVVAVRFFQFVARRLPAEPMVPQGDHMP